MGVQERRTVELRLDEANERDLDRAEDDQQRKTDHDGCFGQCGPAHAGHGGGVPVVYVCKPVVLWPNAELEARATNVNPAIPAIPSSASASAYSGRATPRSSASSERTVSTTLQ